MADMIRENMRSFLRIEPANAQTIQIQENLDFDGNAARNRIWYRGDADELSQMYKLLPGDCQRDRFWAAVPTYGLNIRKIHTGIPGIIVDLLVSIQCIEYKNGARHTLSEYSRMCIKTATTRSYLTGEGEMRKEWGVSTVIMNKRGNPCPKCAPWCGKVMIDDVWSGGKPDGKHPLISTAIEQGLYHPNCKDMHTTYFPGISTADDPYTREEKKQIVDEYNQEQKVNYAKNQAEKYERLSQLSLDPDNKKMYAARAAEWEKKGQNNNVSDNKTKRSAKDVTDRWIKEATPNSHEVIDLKEYVVNGITHVVDNKNIVLDYSSKERRIAELLEGTFGGEVKMVPRVLNPERVSTPDYLYKGEPFDLKEIKGTSKNVIYNAISKKKRQASNFILDITECPLDRDEINRQVGDIYRSTHTRFVDKIIIVDNNEVIQVYQREI